MMVRIVCMVLALAFLAGCYSHRAATGAISPSQSVRVRFAQPREVRFQQGGDSATVPGVRELNGEVLRQTEDSLWLVVRRVGDAGPFDPGVTIPVVRAPGTTVDIRRYSYVKTAFAVAAGGFIGFVVALLAVLSAFE